MSENVPDDYQGEAENHDTVPEGFEPDTDAISLEEVHALPFDGDDEDEFEPTDEADDDDTSEAKG